MTRYSIDPFSGRFEITIGWDRPLNSFFAQVHDLEVSDDDEGDPVVVWVGATHSEILTPEALQLHIARYGTIPDEIMQTLRADRVATLDTGDTRLQRAMRGIAEGN